MADRRGSGSGLAKWHATERRVRSKRAGGRRKRKRVIEDSSRAVTTRRGCPSGDDADPTDTRRDGPATLVKLGTAKKPSGGGPWWGSCLDSTSGLGQSGWSSKAGGLGQSGRRRYFLEISESCDDVPRIVVVLAIRN